MRLLTNKVNIMLAMVAAMFLVMFMLADTAWGLTYKAGDVWIGTDGEEMSSGEAYRWEYQIINENEIDITKYKGTYMSGEILGCMPASINGMEVTALTQTFYYSEITKAPKIPDTVKTMNNTFYLCWYLTSAPEIPNGVTDLTGTFTACTALTVAPQIPDSVTNMSHTFDGCSKLTTAPQIPDSVTDLSYTFSDCLKLTTAPQIPNLVTNMSHTFDGCSKLTTAPQIPNSVEDMSYTFANSGITKAPEIPNSVTNMTDTFYYCSMLTEPSTIPASVTSIAQAYYGTAITKTPQILATNLRYASEAFAYCSSLEEITNIPVAEDVSSMFYECGQLKVVPAIPEGIRALEWVFYNCKELEEIPEIPDSAYKLDGLFNGCSKLTGTMYLNDNVTIVDNMFDNTVEPIIVQYRNNTVVENTTFPSNVTKQKLTDEVIDPGDGDDQTTTTPSNPGETEGNLTIWGTVNPINMIDVTVPLTIEFIIESDRTFTGPDDITIISNCPSPLDVILYGVNKSEEAPTLVAPTTYDDNGWNNLSRADTRAKMALMLSDVSLTDTSATLGKINSAFISEQSLSLDLTAKYGKAWDNSEDHVFTYNVVFEFAMP